MNRLIMSSPIGLLLLEADDRALRGVRACVPGDEQAAQGDLALLDEAKRQIDAYFAGALRQFDLPLSFSASPFDARIYHALLQIPYGDVASYADMARAAGSEGACRAAGRACAKNPLLIVVPCHRVVAGSGKLTGFAAGLEAKRTLLRLEGWQIKNDKLIR